MKKCIFIVILAFVFLAVPLLIVYGLELNYVASRGWQYTEVVSVPSPDGTDLLMIAKRTAFPPSDVFDPSIVVRIGLEGKPNEACWIKLLEDSDLVENPTVVWGTNFVVVSGLSTRRKISVELNR